MPVLSSSAHAGNSLSFVVGGHRIRIEASSHCRSTSCVSVSIPGLYQARRWRDRDDDAARNDTAPAKPPVVTPVPMPIQVAPPASKSQVAAVTVSPPFPPVPAPAVLPPVERPIEIVRSRPETIPRIVKATHGAEDEPTDTPLGEWQSEGNKGSVRIERCGRALCGYAIDSPSNDSGETVLVNMKPKTAARWTGNIYSHDSGDTYYGTMVLQGPNALRVEACALGRFYCTGNVWSRMVTKPARLIGSRQLSPEPRS